MANSSFTQKMGKGSRPPRQAGQDKLTLEQIVEKEFYEKLENDDIDVGDNFYNEEILFTKPKELMNIFEEL